MEAYRRTTTRWYTNSRIYSIVRQHRNEMFDKMERLLCTLAVNPRLYKRMIKFRLCFTSKGVLCEESSSIDAPDFYHSVNTPFASHINIVIVFRHISPEQGLKLSRSSDSREIPKARPNHRQCQEVPQSSFYWTGHSWRFRRFLGFALNSNASGIHETLRSKHCRAVKRAEKSFTRGILFFRVSCLGIIIHHWIHLGVFSCDAIMREVFISVSSGLPKYY